MTIIVCPECGRSLDTERVDVIAHAYAHWRVSPRDVSTLRNTQAQERYHAILSQLKEDGA